MAQSKRDPLWPHSSSPQRVGDAAASAWQFPPGPGVELDNAYPHYFALRARLTPDAVALRAAGVDMTYAELDARSTGRAWRLREMKVGPELLVGVCLDRSAEALISLLSIWKAGGAYLPLDPASPEERLRYILTDSQAAVLITNRLLRQKFSTGRPRMLCVDEPKEDDRSTNASREASVCPASGETLAYVIYTSGSTGRPKGVEIAHRSLLNHNDAIARTYGLCAADRVLQFASLSFDVSLEEITPSWLAGATVVLRPPDIIGSIAAFVEFVARENISVLNLPTAYWHRLVEQLPATIWPDCVRLVVIGGEKASDEAFKRWKQLAPGSVRLMNCYGPTECTITATCYEADPGDDTLPIGRPILNTQAVILDERLQAVPTDAAGELCLAGIGLARGYRNRSDLTAEKFILSPTPGGPDPTRNRLYRTGDRVRRRPDGNLEFLGRLDDQVKIRGFRVEPREIETALLAHAALQEVAVVLRDEPDGLPRLVCYYVPCQPPGPSVNELMTFLKARLPDYMVPSAFVPLASLPLTLAGKVDRHALPKPDRSRPLLERPLLPPRNEREVQLASIWREVLGLDEVGTRDNFFELGGDSLRALQILARIRQVFACEVPLDVLFDCATIEALAAALETGRFADQARSATPCASISENPRSPASFMQEELWFLHHLEPESPAYNLASVLRFTGKLNVNVLEASLDALVRRHEALRTTFRYENSLLTQAILPPAPMRLQTFNLAGAPSGRREAVLRQELLAGARQSFDLETGPLFRAGLFSLGAKDHALLLVMHHTIADGWSLEILYSELEACYRALVSQNSLPPLPEPHASLVDYARQQRESLPETALEQELGFWRQALSGAPAEITFPDRQPAIGTTDGRVGQQRILLPKRTIKAATNLARRHQATPFIVLLSTLAITLYRWTGQRDLVIGTVAADRNHRQFERLVGCLMNFLPLRMNLRGDESGIEILRLARKRVLEAHSHQQCPFAKIVSAVNPRRQTDRNPVYNVALLWHNFPRGGFHSPGLRGKAVPLPSQVPLLDLRLEGEPQADAWAMLCEYNAAKFDEKCIANFLGSFSRALEWLARSVASSAIDPYGRDTDPLRWLRRIWPIGRSQAARTTDEMEDSRRRNSNSAQMFFR